MELCKEELDFLYQISSERYEQDFTAWVEMMETDNEVYKTFS